jgi:hypothetical protein
LEDVKEILGTCAILWCWNAAASQKVDEGLRNEENAALVLVRNGFIVVFSINFVLVT